MKPHSIPLSRSILAIFILAAAFYNGAQAADIVVTDPTRTTSPAADIIDPSGAQTVSQVATGATSQGLIEGLTGIGSIQGGWSGFTGNQSTADNYIFSFTDSTLPDFKFVYGGSIAAAAVAISNNTFSTSNLLSMRLNGVINQATSLTVYLGSWNGTAFTTMAANSGVEALALTLTGNYPTGGVTFTFLDAGGTILSTQAVTTAGSAAGYAGYQISGVQNPIAALQISFTSASTAALFGLDDLTFTSVITSPIPEPSTYALILGGLFLAAAAFRRPAKK